MLHKKRLNDKTMEERWNEQTYTYTDTKAHTHMHTVARRINQFENVLIEMHYAFICHQASSKIIQPFATKSTDNIIKDFRGVSN